ncbi:methylmalonyl Co-A mutase-associated GTPase MeaB [Faecalibacter rhinopitheci]|uniref:Methylmalonyl Co-A mutase-associated GTPase MeaB n=1 Tax=Faecalibacter rhinopitheci TaxID=2779678 RepID=A0A8J7FPB8_9FLAO|nr:methylmalonyl Co-A mutase-associated GTPase MeaB [Faecalibacter rhinopitheci]MBF0596874.1 methylmalonyl Co-A mutase-associated GTPase MeaB [Faecalibacter rhinopitheci]
MSKTINTQQLINDIKDGKTFALSRAITLAESTRIDHLEVAQEIIQAFPLTKSSKRIAITGIPGVGKSTFIEALGQFLVSRGKKVAILAIDPSSSLSKGSILGDKTRMEELSKSDLAYIRPSATNGNLGGITSRTYEAMLLCEAAGYDHILIETVGVGQSETLVNKISDLFLFLQLPGSGDDLQGIKRGIMEMADIIFINKIDAFQEKLIKDAKVDLARSLQFLPTKASQWKRQTILGSGLKEKGINELWETIEKYFEVINHNGFYEKNRRQQQFLQAETYVLEIIERQTKEKLKAKPFDESFVNAYEMAKEWMK